MSNASAGFNIAAVVGGDKLSVWVPFIDGCEVKINYVSRGELREIAKRATKTSFDPKSHQKIEEIDWDKRDQELGLLAVDDWKGFVNGDQPFSCTQENIKAMMANWSIFAKFVGDICVDLEALIETEKEAARKNSPTGSLPAKTTQD